MARNSNQIALPNFPEPAANSIALASRATPPFVLNTNALQAVSAQDLVSPYAVAEGNAQHHNNSQIVSVPAGGLFLELWQEYTFDPEVSGTADATLTGGATVRVYGKTRRNAANTGFSRRTGELPHQIDDTFAPLGHRWLPLSLQQTRTDFSHDLGTAIATVHNVEQTSTDSGGDAGYEIQTTNPIYLWLAGSEQVLAVVETAASGVNVSAGMILGRFVS